MFPLLRREKGKVAIVHLFCGQTNIFYVLPSFTIHKHKHSVAIVYQQDSAT